jgi:hypothetical protein
MFPTIPMISSFSVRGLPTSLILSTLLPQLLSHLVLSACSVPLSLNLQTLTPWSSDLHLRGRIRSLSMTMIQSFDPTDLTEFFDCDPYCTFHNAFAISESFLSCNTHSDLSHFDDLSEFADSTEHLVQRRRNA